MKSNKKTELEKSKIQKQKQLYILFSVAVFVFALILYGNTIRNKYALDDQLVTYPNTQIAKGIQAIPEIFTTRYATEGDMTYGYRPLVKTTFAIEYELWGFKPGRSHFINVLLYAITGLLMFSLLRKLFNKYSLVFPFLITMLFMAHPLHTEVVASLKNRDEILGLLFNLATLISLVQYTRHAKIRHLIQSVVFFLFVLISKPSAGAFIIIYPLVLYFFTNIKPKTLVAFSSVSVVLLVLFLLIPKLLLPGNVRPYMFYENPLFYDSTILQRLGTGLLILLEYMKLVIFPYPLRFYYGFDMIPVVTPLNGLAILSFLIHAGLLVVAILKFKQKHIISFAILLYLFAIAPYSNFLFPSPGMVAERFAYTASLAVGILLVYALFKAFNKDSTFASVKGSMSSLIFIIPVFLLTVYSVYTINRNKDWKDHLTLYESDIKHLDKSVKAHMLYASAMALEVSETFDMNKQAKMVQLIPRHYNRAIELYPENYEAMINLGSFYMLTMQNYNKAIILFNNALDIEPNRYEPYYNLAYAYEKLGDTVQSLESYKKAVNLAPDNLPLRSDYSNLLYLDGQIDAALLQNYEMLKRDSTFSEIYINLGNIYMINDSASGIYYWEKAMSLEPEYKMSMDISWYYRQKLDTARTWYYYNMAQTVKPRMNIESK